jgi:hypothetical protein
VANCPGPQDLGASWGPLVIFCGSPVIFSGEIFVYRAKNLCFSAKVPKFGMGKIGECAMKATKTLSSGKNFQKN